MASSLSDSTNIIKKNKVLIGTLVIIFVCFGTYYWYLYSEYKKERDIHQKTRVAGICPDYWVNTGDGSKPSLICRNEQKIGRCNLNTGELEKDFGIAPYNDKINGDLAKCKWSKYCNAPWEGIDHLCSDIGPDNV